MICVIHSYAVLQLYEDLPLSTCIIYLLCDIYISLFLQTPQSPTNMVPGQLPMGLAPNIPLNSPMGGAPALSPGKE